MSEIEKLKRAYRTLTGARRRLRLVESRLKHKGDGDGETVTEVLHEINDGLSELADLILENEDEEPPPHSRRVF